MHLSKRGLSNANRIVLDQNEHLNVRSAKVRGDLHVMGRIINHGLLKNDPEVVREVVVETPTKAFCELTMNCKTHVKDNELFEWVKIDIRDDNVFDGKSTITIPTTGLYQINVRVHDFGNGLGSGISFWVNDVYTYAYVSNTDNDCTNALHITKPFQEGDQLQVKSILDTLVDADHTECYTFQVAQIS